MDLMQIIIKGQEVLSQIVVIITALIAIAMIIPGAEPETTLQKVLDFIKKFSKK
jgi:hypothetical protein